MKFKNFAEVIHYVKHNKSEMRLVIGDLLYTQHDIENLVNTLNENAIFTELVLHGNNISLSTSHCLNCKLSYEIEHKHLNQLTVADIKNLTNCKFITTLDIRNNNIGEEGARILALTGKFKKLILKNCNINLAGAKYFLQNKDVIDIDLWLNPFDGDDLTALDEHTKKNLAKKDPVRAALEIKAEAEQTLENEVMRAIEQESTEIALEKIKLLPNGINTHFYYGCNVLQYAIDKSKSTLAKRLLEYGALLENTTEDDKTPLFYAAEQGLSNIVHLLLNAGSNLTGEFYFNKEIPLSIAAAKIIERVANILNPIKHEEPINPVYKAMPKQLKNELSNYLQQYDRLTSIGVWLAVSEEDSLLFDYTYKALEYWAFLSNHLSQNKEANELNAYVTIYKTLHDKYCIIK
ncbi:MAG: ankyrin repeat domain-containing protein, partial [Gammaproteobacteria bacterium]